MHHHVNIKDDEATKENCTKDRDEELDCVALRQEDVKETTQDEDQESGVQSV